MFRMAGRMREAVGDVLPALLVHAAFVTGIVSILQGFGSIHEAGLPFLP